MSAGPTVFLAGPIVSLCGWCPDAKQRTEELTRQGFAVSHGVCRECLPKLRVSLGPPEKKGE